MKTDSAKSVLACVILSHSRKITQNKNSGDERRNWNLNLDWIERSAVQAASGAETYSLRISLVHVQIEHP